MATNADSTAAIATTVNGSHPDHTINGDSASMKVDDGKPQTGEKEATTPAPAKLPHGSQSVVKQLFRHEKAQGEPIITEKQNLDSKDPYDCNAVVVTTVYNHENKLEKTTLKINSQYILKALKDVVTFYPSEPLDFNFEEGGSYEVLHPYMMLQHHFDDLHTYSDGDVSTETRDHLAVLLKFLESEGKEARILRDASLTNFKNLWLIYKPGELLFQSSYGHNRLYRISQVGYKESPQAGKSLEIRCTFTSCDGVDVGTAAEKLSIFERQEFVHDSATPITNLSTFPFSFVGDDDQQAKIRETLVERGQRYLQIKGIGVRQYEGLYLYLKEPPNDFYDECATYSGTWLPATTHGRIIIDAKTFSEEATKQADSIIPRSRCGSSEDDDNSEFRISSTVADPLLAPPHVFGFSLETKKWAKFFVDTLKETSWDANALESLVLPTHRKDVIRALVTAHKDHSVPLPAESQWAQKRGSTTSSARNEAMAKGKGLIVLLHGEPGSGKTLTAELMAEHTRRPLLNISVGELGSWQHRITHELKRLLTYASIWKAIVLIDEADVFLETRSTGASEALGQNALVAVFLRQLEYFQGIAFLTSNRVEVFDAAVKSRIHLALRYESPDVAVRSSLWAKKLGGLRPEEKDLDVEEVVQKVCAAEMNGREISNAVNTARTLAADQGRKVDRGHVETVVQLWKEFNVSNVVKA